MNHGIRIASWRQKHNPVKGDLCAARAWPVKDRRDGFTLVEVLVASALILMIMLILIQVFAAASGAASLSRNLRELDQRAAGAMGVLRSDLEGLTLVPNPPHDPANGEGYLEIEENSLSDFEREDGDDVLAFTSRKEGGEMFQGRYGYNRDPLTGILTPLTAQSDTAEVIYFLRDQVLYRRQLLVMPSQPKRIDFPRYKWSGAVDRAWVTGGKVPQMGAVPYSWYHWFDISARFAYSNTGFDLTTLEPLVNSLESLTKRENRYAHLAAFYPHRAVGNQESGSSPSPVANLFHQDNDFNGNSDFVSVRQSEMWFGRPLLRETAHPAWDWPGGMNTFDRFYNQAPLDQNGDGLIDIDWVANADVMVNPTRRISEDILLTNVLSFDIKVYDPGAPIFGSVHHEEDEEEGEHEEGEEHGELIGPPYDLNRNGVAYGDEIHAGNTIVGFGAYVDMGYGMNQNPYNTALALDPAQPLPMFTPGNPAYLFSRNLGAKPLFWHNGSIGSAPGIRLVRTYDTWSTSYETDGLDQDGFNGPDTGTNGIDDNVNGSVDEAPDGIDDPWKGDSGIGLNGQVDELSEHEWEAPAPYTVPLRGIQIRIRLFDQTSNQAREYTLTHDF